jgi:pimeloyl-ACP methyl ester carboxylesterase
MTVILILNSLAVTTVWFIRSQQASSELEGIGSTFITALVPAIELGERRPLGAKSVAPESEQPVTVWFEGETSRLVVVVPGLGGNSIDSMNLWFARPFLQENDNVWVLPSPTHHTYADAFIKSFDYSESVASLCRIVEDGLQRMSHLGLKEIVLAGYSLGARHVISMASCASLVKRHGSIKLSVLALNPPISLIHASNVLHDAAKYANANFGKTALVGLYFLLVQRFLPSEIALQDFLSASYVNQLEQNATTFIPPVQEFNRELQGLVATVFNRKLSATYQKVTGQKIAGETTVFQEITLGSGSWSHVDKLKSAEVERAIANSDGRLLLFHTRDDFLTQAEMLQEFMQRFPQNVVLWDTGGHVGAIFQSEYLKKIDSTGVLRR